MGGDFTRDTFDPSKQYSRVLMQQGRVQLDADWNEQTSILLHYMRTLAVDLFGPHAGPAKGAGFEIIGKSTPPDWEAKLKAMFPGQVDEKRLETLRNAVTAGNIVITPGRYYVGGVPVANHAATLYTEQLSYPRGEMKDEDRFSLWKANVVFYLDVWERDVSWLDDGHIREVALGGPDTCTRAQVCWQVRALLPGGEARIDCSDVDKIARNTGTLAAMAHNKSAKELCVISAESRYRGAENQLYRVEIHKGGKTDSATYKWSRENGSVVFPITSLGKADATGKASVTLGHAGRDRRSGLKDGDWVEVVDDVIASGNSPGILARVKGPPQHLNVTLEFAGNLAGFPSYADKDFQNRHPMLRRWDHVGDIKADGAIPIVDAKWAELEDGVRVQFATGQSYGSGDYWLIPARTATGDLDWPSQFTSDGKEQTDAEGNRIGAALPPHGPVHYYAPLASWSGGTWKDCRSVLAPLQFVNLNAGGT